MKSLFHMLLLNKRALHMRYQTTLEGTAIFLLIFQDLSERTGPRDHLPSKKRGGGTSIGSPLSRLPVDGISTADLG